LKYIVGSASGVVCSLPRVLYIIRASGDTAWFVTRDGVLFKRDIEMSEVRLKIALSQGKGDELARRIVSESRPIGLSILEFAARNGRYEIAAALATDPVKRFDMTLRAGDLTAAASIADEIADEETFKTLASAALEVGRFSLAEYALKKANDTEGLAFLYLISGESDKLSRLSKQTNSLLHQLWSNDDDAIARTLAAAAPDVKLALQNGNELHITFGTKVLADWPMTRTASIHTTIAPALPDDEEAGAGWSSGAREEEEEEPAAGGWDVDLDIETPSPARGKGPAQFVPPRSGPSVHQQWAEHARTAGERIAAGLFGDALVLLDQTVALRNTDAVKDLFVETYISANAAVNAPGGQLAVPLSMPFRSHLSPAVPTNLELFDGLTNSLYGLFVKGKFVESRQLSLGIMKRVLVSTVATKEDEQKILEVLDIAKNYCLAVSMELQRKTETNATRKLEIALYMTHLKLAAPHLRIVLHSAMRAALQAGNYVTAIGLAQRLVQLDPPQKVLEQARAAITTASAKNTNALTIEYSEQTFNVCARSLKPLYRGKPSVFCPLCKSVYAPAFKGQLCVVCELCEIGADVPGMRLVRSGK
jgi:coatomer protein complex subunit alpha (xenin)